MIDNDNKHRRLLDMLAAGWSNNCDEEEEADKIGDLYQEAARLDIENDDPDADKKITAFVINKVIPFLLGK